MLCFFFQAEDGIRDGHVTGVQTCALPIFLEFMKGVGGFAYGGFCGSPECEAEVKQQTGAPVRVLPDPEFRSAEAPKTCMWRSEERRVGKECGSRGAAEQ